MSAFGENLRREREMRGVSLDEISFATKISLRFLEAIEREDFSKLPGGIFSRSFIRTYARYLGLDEDRVVAEFQLAAQPQTDFDLHRMAAGNSRFGRPGQKSTLIATVVAVVFLAAGYMLFRYSRRAAEAPPPPLPAPMVMTQPVPASPAAPAPTLPTTADSSAVPAGSVVTGAPSVAGAPGVPSANLPASAPNAQTPPALGSMPAAVASAPTMGLTAPAAVAPQSIKPATDAEMVLQMAATDRAWVGVEADGKTVFQRVLNPNEVQTFHAQKSFDVTAGNAQSVILTLNGETLKPLGRRNEVKSVHLTRDDLKHTTP